MVVNRFDENVGEPPFLEQSGSQFVVIGVKLLLLQTDQFIRGCTRCSAENFCILVGKQGGQR